MTRNVKRCYKFGSLILLIFLIGGSAGVIGERFVMPWLSKFPKLQNYSFFQKANERVTVINQTKEIKVTEDFSVANIAEKVSPAVVSIVSFQEEVKSDNKKINKIKFSQDIQNNIKTGLILTNDGLIMSVLDENIENILAFNENPENNESIWKFKVLADNNMEFDVEVVAIDHFNNLIFYKAEKENLPVPSFGDSANIEIGEKVVICGNAGGEYQNSFSSGLVKEKDQTFTLFNSELASSEKKEGVILLDAKIENRNIGGPVVDYNGNVIGIVNQIEKDGEKVGFVVPIDDVKLIIDKVIKKEALEYPSLGVYYLSINREIALLNNLDVNRGALVYSFSEQQGLAVIKDSAADKAGIKIGDIILAVNGELIDLNNPLSKLISMNKPGDEIEISLIRAEEKINLKVVLK